MKTKKSDIANLIQSDNKKDLACC